MKISYGKEKSQNIRVLIATIKVRRNYDNAKMAKCLGLTLSTYQSRVHDPSTFRAWELWNLMQLGKVPDSEKANYL